MQYESTVYKDRRALLYLLELGQFDFHIDRDVVGVGEGVVHDDVRSEVLVAVLLDGDAGDELAGLHDVTSFCEC